MDTDKDKNSEDNEKAMAGQQQREQQPSNDVTLTTHGNKQNARSGSENDDINEQKSKDSNNKNKNNAWNKPSSQSNDLKLENKSEAKKNGNNDNPNEQESQIVTPAQWGKKNGIPVEWLKGFKSFRAMTKIYGQDDSGVFIKHIEKKFREVSFDEMQAIGNLFDKLDKHRGNRQSNGM